MNRRLRPRCEPLEPRALLAVIYDVDLGTPALAPNVSTLPYNFFDGTPGAPPILHDHGITMARDFLAADPADTLVELAAGGPDGHYTVDSIVAAITYAATEGRRLHPRETVEVAVPLSGAGDPTVSSFVGSLPFLQCERLCARAGISLSVAAGNDGVDLDATPAYLASTVVASPNVLAMAAVRPDGTLQPWSNYGVHTVMAAATTDDGTSAASVLGAVALAHQADAHPLPRHPSKAVAAKYARDIVKATIRGAAADFALAGLVGGGVVLAQGSRVLPLRHRNTSQK